MATECLQLSPMQKFSTLLKNLSVAAPVAAAFWLGTGLATSTSAAIINGTISGTVTSVIGSEQGVMLGSTGSGTYSYDNAITISETYNYSDGFQATFVGYPLQAFELSIGDSPITFNLSDLERSVLSQPAILISGPLFPRPPGVDFLNFQISSSAINSFLGVPGFSGGLSATYPQGFSTVDERGNFFIFTFTATSTPASVPEPSTVAGISVLGLCWLLRKKLATCRRT